MAFGRKLDLLMALNPDILLVQEVSRKDIEVVPADFKYWVGSNPHKGMAFFAFGDFGCEVCGAYTDELPWFIPVQIASLNLNVVGVWASKKTSTLRYVRVTHSAIDHYEAFIRSAPTILMGDFNSNTIWDRLHRKQSHSLLVGRLGELGMSSLYHRLHGEEHGAEQSNTQFMYRNREKGYHIDYAFLPEQMIDRATLTIGGCEEWLRVSDHMPLIMDVR